MASDRQLSSANVIFLLIHDLEQSHRVYPSPEQVWRVLWDNHRTLVMSNDVDWPIGYFVEGPPSDSFVADIEELIDCLALNQRPDNGLIVHTSGGAYYRRRTGSLPQSINHIVDALWRLMKPRKKSALHQTYRAAPDKPPT